MTTTEPDAQQVEQAVGNAAQELYFPLPPSFDSVEAERQYRKEQLAAGFRIFGKFGFSEGVAGHITVRDPEFPDTFWVNGFGQSFSQIKASDLIRCDHDGTVLEGRFHVNRAAFVIHAEVHRARPDVIAAAHSHSLYGKAFAALGVASDVEEGKRIATALAGYKAAILQNHGLITVGESVAEAVWWFVTMERSCQAQLLAMAAGTPKLIDRETALMVREQIGGHFAGWFQARPLWDQIVVSDPDLFG
jgi:ribulose-5-phosphate 4-epimerase/fuculose-1-phosphate aldolase